MKNRRKFLWAVDIYAADRSTQKAVYRVLEKLAVAEDARIEPVYVLSPEELRVPKKAFDGHSRDYRLEAEKELQKWVSRLKNPRLEAPRLLLQPKLSLSSTVDTLLDYARACGAALIGVGTTTSQKPANRFFLGSFAETVTIRSRIPLLVINPATAAPGPLHRILFATDFSAASRMAFTEFLPTAKALGAEVILYSKCEYMIPDWRIPGLSLDYAPYLELDRESRRKGGKKWLSAAEEAHVPASLYLDQTLGTTSESIFAAARKKNAGLIALASRSGPLGAMLGSIARQVVRRSPLPVWVIHPAKKRRPARRKERDTSRRASLLDVPRRNTLL